MSATLLKTKTHYSLLNSLIRPDKLAQNLKSKGYSSCALTDHNSISGAVEFSNELKKESIKPILGCEFYIKNAGDIVVLAKNKKGWSELIQLASKSYNKENIDKSGYASLNLSDFAEYKNLICCVGHNKTITYNTLFGSYFNGAWIKDGEVSNYLNPSGQDEVAGQLNLLTDIFGKDNVFLEIQNIANFAADKVIIDIYRNLAKKLNIKCISTQDPHFLEEKDQYDLQLLLYSKLNTTFKKFKVENNESVCDLILSTKNAIFNSADIININTAEEIDNANYVASLCEEYTITGRPRLPSFPCPNNLSEMEYLKELAREGYKIKYNESWDAQVYGDRAKKELAVIEKANLPGYFLIVQDYTKFAKNNGWLVGPARGSCAGSLISYLIDITTVDPIPFNLIFERFYNDGRNTADRVSYPDIDMDFPISHREEVIEYIRNKYGRNYVSQMVTFGRHQGRGALKDVLRIHEVCDMNTMNEITKKLPHEHEIADKLEEDGEESIIKWTLNNEPELISDYCRIDDKGVLTGDLAQYFEQASRIEGIFKSQGKHAAGIIISPEPLANLCPMISDKSSDEKICGMEMNSLELLGLVKMDILGVAALDKCDYVNELLKG